MLLKTITYRIFPQVNESASFFRQTSFISCLDYFKVGLYLCTKKNIHFATTFFVKEMLLLKKHLKVDCGAIGVTFKWSNIKSFTAEARIYVGYYFGKDFSFSYLYGRIVSLGFSV